MRVRRAESDPVSAFSGYLVEDLGHSTPSAEQGELQKAALQRAWGHGPGLPGKNTYLKPLIAMISPNT